MEVGLQIGILEKVRFYLTNDGRNLIFTSEERRIVLPQVCIKEMTVSRDRKGSIWFKIVGEQNVLKGSTADTKQAHELFLTLRNQLGQNALVQLDFNEITYEN